MVGAQEVMTGEWKFEIDRVVSAQRVSVCKDSDGFLYAVYKIMQSRWVEKAELLEELGAHDDAGTMRDGARGRSGHIGELLIPFFLSLKGLNYALLRRALFDHIGR